LHYKTQLEASNSLVPQTHIRPQFRCKSKSPLRWTHWSNFDWQVEWLGCLALFLGYISFLCSIKQIRLAFQWSYCCYLAGHNCIINDN